MFSKNGIGLEIKTLEKIYQLFNKAEKQLSKKIGVPICTPNCGKCCETNCISIKGVEARYIALWLRKQKPEFQKKVLDACRKWLLEPIERVGTKHGLGTAGMSPEMIDQLNLEVGWLYRTSWCPMLTEDKRCLIHQARPIVCWAYAVTRLANVDQCHRPLGKVEHEQFRAYLKNETTDEIKDTIEKLKGDVTAANSYLENQGFLAALLFLEMEPQKFLEHAYHNEIAAAKLVHVAGGSIIWQEQIIDRVDTDSDLRMVCNPIAVPEEFPDGLTIQTPEGLIGEPLEKAI